jgi:SAM-dependent methyltransferase
MLLYIQKHTKEVRSMGIGDIYINGEYLRKNPQWGAEDSPWKADQILKIMKNNGLKPETICEIGCGAGGILKSLQEKMDERSRFFGYEISPYAFDLCQRHANERLQFSLMDFSREKEVFFDLILAIDLIEHLEDYFQFLRLIKSKSDFKIFHVPLEMFALAILSRTFIPGQRRSSGHLHFFTKGLVLQALQDLGYEVIDYFYTPGALQGNRKGLSDLFLYLPRIVFFSMSPDIAVRLFGGYSLMVLAR